MLAFLLGGQPDTCNGGPTVSSINLLTNNLNVCGSNGWVTTWDLTAGALLPGQEFYFERATNLAGDNWSFAERNTDGLVTWQDGEIGSDGAFGGQTNYIKLRVYVTPTNGSPSTACSGPITGAQLSKAGQLCVS